MRIWRAHQSKSLYAFCLGKAFGQCELLPNLFHIAAPILFDLFRMSQVWLQHNSDQNVGDQLHSRNTSTKMLGIVYNVDRRVWSLYFPTPLEATGSLSHVGIAADKVSDKRMRQWQ